LLNIHPVKKITLPLSSLALNHLSFSLKGFTLGSGIKTLPSFGILMGSSLFWELLELFGSNLAKGAESLVAVSRSFLLLKSF
jgi:hypothetical protein